VVRRPSASACSSTCWHTAVASRSTAAEPTASRATLIAGVLGEAAGHGRLQSGPDRAKGDHDGLRSPKVLGDEGASQMASPDQAQLLVTELRHHERADDTTGSSRPKPRLMACSAMPKAADWRARTTSGSAPWARSTRSTSILSSQLRRTLKLQSPPSLPVETTGACAESQLAGHAPHPCCLSVHRTIRAHAKIP